MLATLSLEREPITFHDVLPGLHNFHSGLEVWVRVVGSIAALGILLWAMAYWLTQRAGTRGRAITVPQLVLMLILFATGGFIIYLAVSSIFERLRRRPADDEGEVPAGSERRRSTPRELIFLILSLFSGVMYLLLLPCIFFPSLLNGVAKIFAGNVTPESVANVRWRMLTIAGAAALLAALIWPLCDLFTLRWHVRRIWAIALVSLKEAVRRRVLWVFLVVLLFFLFGMWFLPTKPEDQIRSYVQAVFLVFAVLLVVTLSLVAAFSIPTDIKSQTIHTIFTKPVERFELVLGRFLGYAVLMTMVLAGLTGFSLLYLMREIDKEAAAESLKARVPIYGALEFYENDLPVPKGTNVGRPWEYRSYIGGERTGTSRQSAVWRFQELPTGLESRESVPCEFGFDIYRTSKGTGVWCSFTFKTWHWEGGNTQMQQQRELAYRQERSDEAATDDPEFNLFVTNWLILKYGYYSLANQEISNLRTFSLDLPVALFEDPARREAELKAEAAQAPAAYKAAAEPNLGSMTEQQRKALRQQEAGMSLADRKRAFLFREMPSLHDHVKQIEEKDLKRKKDKLEIRVTCDSTGQYIGMASRDLYLLDSEQSFAVNFCKGAMGLWLLLLVVLGLNVALSTYLSAIISWLAGLFWLLMGLIRDFIADLTRTDVPTGGPMESLYRLTHRQGLNAPVGDTAAYSVALRSDDITRLFFKALLFVIPDFDQFWFSAYVEEGFNIAFARLAVGAIFLLAYTIPLALLAYYTMKWREVASSQ